LVSTAALNATQVRRVIEGSEVGAGVRQNVVAPQADWRRFQLRLEWQVGFVDRPMTRRE